MPDKTNELWDLGDGATVRLTGRVKKVFPTKNGESQYGPWYKTDFVLVDDVGEVTVSWFHNDHPECPIALQGATVRAEGKVKVFTRSDNKQGLGVSANDVEALGGEGAPQATQAPNPTPTPSQAGNAPQGAQRAVEQQGTGQALPLAEYQRWWLARWEWYEGSPPVQRAIARGESVALAIRDAIGAEWMSQSPYDRNVERTPHPGVARAAQAPPEPPPSAHEEEYDWRQDDDSDVPFALFLAPLLGGLLPWLT